MRLLRIKILLLNLNSVNIRNYFFYFFNPGFKGDDSVFIPVGKFYHELQKGSSINVKSGIFSINTDFVKPNPYFAVLKLGRKAEINVSKTFNIHSSSHIILMDNAKLNLGSGYISRNCKIRCFQEITIGENCSISENFTVWDSDAHRLEGKEDQMTKPVKIGNHVWIGTNVTVLKGTKISDGCVIAAGSVVSGSFPENSLIGGVPAKVIKENIFWK